MSFAGTGRIALGIGIAGALAASVIYYLVASRPPPGPSASTSRPAWPDFAATQAGAEAGDPAAQAGFARMHAAGHGTRRDYAEAARWYRKAAEQGNADAQAGLAELYEAGQGVPLDFAEAAKWYRRAADQGHGAAQFGLAVLYEFGRGVAKDQAEAAAWFRRAADQGDVQAQYNLGQRYSMGVGVKADPVQAYKWLRLAGRQGLEDATKAADALQSTLSSGQLTEARQAVDSFLPTATRR